MPRWVSLLLLPAALAGAGFGERFESVKREASKEELYALLYALPKGGDLHNHFSLTPTPESWYRHAASDPARYYTRTRIDHCATATLPTLQWAHLRGEQYDALDACVKAQYKLLRDLSDAERAAWRSALVLDKPGEARDEFFEAVARRVGMLARNPDIMERVFLDHARALRAEGALYFESQITPTLQAGSTGKPVSPDEFAARFRRLLAAAEFRSLGLEARFQYSVLRFAADAEARVEAGYDFVARNNDLWKAVNLVGREDNDQGHALRFLETLRKLRRKYSSVRLSIHGGESSAPGRQVRDTLLLGAERIGHGINLIWDPDLMLLFRTGRFLVEINLVSNRLLGYVPDPAQHPFAEYLRTGIPVCLNTDDPGAWDSNFTDEYFTAVTAFDLRWEELVRLGRHSLQFSFAEEPLKDALLDRYAGAVRAFEVRFAGDWRAELKKVQPAVSGYARRNLLR
jgi:adenosine deaminase CECR1